MIKNLKLKNFKCFENLDIDLKNVNVFTGVNGMGKSTVIQSLLLLEQSKREKDVKSGLYLNGQYINLGNSQDVVYDKALDENLEITYTTTEGGQNKNVYSFKQDMDYLPLQHAINCEEESAYKHFVYISAYRIKPQERYTVINEKELYERKFGNSGEFALQYLSVYGNEAVRNKCVIEPYVNAGGDSLINQTRLWMDRVSPGVSPQIKVMMETRSSELNFDFIEGRERSNSYKSVNVGFGITYVLPVVVALLTAEEGDIVIIENPEAHIHPAGQRMLGELIARVGAGGVQVLVETHSEHVVNGIRISVKNKQISKDKVQVDFFYKDEEDGYKHKYQPLKVTEAGKMSSWPQGFLDEWENSLIELL